MVQKLLVLDRRQRALLPGVNCDYLLAFHRVLYLKQCFFLIFINDIVNELGSCLRLFADDTSLFIIVDDPVSSAERLNADTIKILQWAETWLVTFIPNKPNHLSSLVKLTNLDSHPFMNNQQLLEVN